jgi:hypothetical protein
MVEKINKWLPLLSLVAVVTGAVFNFGYFWIVGLPFAGLMDLSNLVYGWHTGFFS